MRRRLQSRAPALSSSSHIQTAGTTRVEYSEPEQLDRILEHLRRIRDEHEAGYRPPRREPVAEIHGAVEAAPQASEASTADHAAKVPPADAAGRASPLRHMPKAALDRLATFVAGGSHPPRPLGRYSVAEPPPSRIKSAARGPRPAKIQPSPQSTSPSARSELRAALHASRDAFLATGTFSFVINVLMLTGPLFMLQVYDRVMTSGSMSTLVALSVLTAAIYGVIGLLELVRSRVIVRIGVELDRQVGDRIFEASLQKSLSSPGSSLLALRELDNVRQFISGPGPSTFFDAPWTPVYLFVVFLLHWSLGLAAVIGTVLLVLIAWASEVRSRASLQEAGKAAGKSLELAETAQRNAEAITAMGMLAAYRARWQKSNAESLSWQVLAADRLGTMSSLSKSLRLLLQSMMLAIGAALAIRGEISAGAIVAGTIIFGRALAPVEQAIGQWRGFVKARDSFAKLEALLHAHPRPPERLSLPKPRGHLTVTSLRVAAPESRTLILSNVAFTLEPGRMVAVIGPSASGKSSLARTLVGLWTPVGGEVRLDGARLQQWNSEELGRHIGYLPQDVELFAGTVRENISRFQPDATDEAVVAAAKAAHAHDMIMALPQSYETQLGAFGTYLSAGQRQRIGLARALYGDPALVVLDEPNSNLDRSGDEALSLAIDGMRARGQAIVLVSHRVQAIGKADYLLYLERGVQRAFGPRSEVIKYLQNGGLAHGPADAPAQAPPSPSSRPESGARPTSRLRRPPPRPEGV